MDDARPTERRTALLAAAAFAWLCASLPVFSQESYYWAYAQHPALCYVDHPPMVAWLIWLGTHVCGDGALGIRLWTWLAGCGTALVGLGLLREFGVDARGREMWLVAGVGVPALAAARFVASPDPPLVYFSTATLLALWRARGGAVGWWVTAGVCAGCAGLSKYSAAFLGIGGALVIALDPRMRRQLRRPGPYLAVAVAALAFAPVVVWNAGHDWRSFLFQTGDRFVKAQLGVGWLAQFLLGQVLLVGPVVALLLLPGLGWMARRARGGDVRLLWLLAFGLPLPLAMGANALWIQVKVNWLLPAWVPLLLGLIVWERETGWLAARPRWTRAVLASVVVVCAALPLAPLVRMVPSTGGPSWHGWRDVAERAAHRARELGAGRDLFFFASSHHDSAQLYRALAIELRGAGLAPDALGPTLSEDVLGEPAREFDEWDEPERHVGADAIFVLTRADDRLPKVDAARRRFRSIERVERVTATFLGVDVLVADLFVCRGYQGPVVDDRGR